MARAAAEVVSKHAERAAREEGRFTIALAGGSTPRRAYSLLAERVLPWGQMHFFWGDERHVPPDHAESNYRMALEAFFSKVAVPESNVHRIAAEMPDAREAAAHYTAELRSFFELGPGEWPRFDLVLLGMGADGHTASLFPGSESVRDRTHLVAAPWVEKLQAYRITLTSPVLLAAAAVVVLVGGAEKAETLRAVLEGPVEPDKYPVQLLLAAGDRVEWITDREASRLLKRD